jgi:LysM repeat protein
VAVACAVALLLGGGLGVAAAEPPPQQRYAAQPGDSLDGIAAEFGVDPAAIAAASGLDDPAALQPAQIVVIPAPGQTPEDAARMAAELHGTSPFAVGAHLVAPGDTLVRIAEAHGVAPQAIAEFNALAEPDNLGVGQRLLIPPPEGVGGVGSPGGVFVPGVPTYVQQRNLSCEYAAAYIATSAFGAGVPEEAFLATVPPARNPHWGYRGNIDGWWGNTDDYGVYAEALVPTLEANGFAAEVFYGGGDPEALRARIDIGKPVVTWLGYWGDTGVTLEDEGVYTVAAGMHVVVAYGYDEGGVHVSNPARGTYEYFPWAEFSAMWQVLDGMGLAVAPAG